MLLTQPAGGRVCVRIYDYAGGAVIAAEAGAHVHRGGSGGPTAAAESEHEVRRLIAAI